MLLSATTALYVNGVEVAGSLHLSDDTLALVDHHWTVGTSSIDVADRFATGYIDDVRVYDVALAAGEILAIYDATAPLHETD